MAVKSRLKQAQPLLLAGAIALAFVACDERLDSGAACPTLCPPPPTNVRDTTFFAVALDSSIVGFPALGQELELFIATFGDTLETRGVMRFDSLPQTFRHNNQVADTAIFAIDTGAALLLRIVTGDTIGQPTTLEAYDVDLGGVDDTNPTAAVSAFTPDRLLGTRTVPAESLKDSVRIPLDPRKLLQKVQADSPFNRLRVGIRVGQGNKIRVLTTNSVAQALVLFRPAIGDTSVPPDTIRPQNRAPGDATKADLEDYLVVAKAPPPPPSSPQTILRIGGLPPRRTYLRFNIPSRIIDSSNVIRATLLLTQVPNRGAPRPRDTVALSPFVISAGPAITDISRALSFVTSPVRVDSVRLFAADSGVKSFEIIRLMSFWQSTTADKTPRAVALRSNQEGNSPLMIDFFSIEAPTAVRPQLRVTFIPRHEGGLP
jgi:hypothetical protein